MLKVMAVAVTRIRSILRWVHIALGLVVMCYIYSPFHAYHFFQIVVKFMVIPTITISGIWLWKFQAFNKCLGIRCSAEKESTRL